MRVFIVDDSAIVAERIAAMVTELSDEIVLAGQAQDAPGAVAAVRAQRPDVVILDIQLLRGSGLDVLAAVKRDCPDTTVMMLTNFPYPQYRQRCMEAGAEFFFDKSTEFHKVRDTLQCLCRKARSRGPHGGFVKEEGL